MESESPQLTHAQETKQNPEKEKGNVNTVELHHSACQGNDRNYDL